MEKPIEQILNNQEAMKVETIVQKISAIKGLVLSIWSCLEQMVNSTIDLSALPVYLLACQPFMDYYYCYNTLKLYKVLKENKILYFNITIVKEYETTLVEKKNQCFDALISYIKLVITSCTGWVKDTTNVEIHEYLKVHCLNIQFNLLRHILYFVHSIYAMRKQEQYKLEFMHEQWSLEEEIELFNGSVLLNNELNKCRFSMNNTILETEPLSNNRLNKYGISINKNILATDRTLNEELNKYGISKEVLISYERAKKDVIKILMETISQKEFLFKLSVSIEFTLNYEEIILEIENKSVVFNEQRKAIEEAFSNFDFGENEFLAQKKC